MITFNAVINGVATIAGAVGVAALTVTTFGAGGIVTAAVVGASVGVSATATVDMVKGETSSIETYIGLAIGGAIGGVLGTQCRQFKRHYPARTQKTNKKYI